MFILTEKRLYIGRIYLCLSLRRESLIRVRMVAVCSTDRETYGF